ncbi:MAG: glycosyltransferase [Parabacteroides sp.]|nr:glycosyltransferase [Parabacteroides sp.]
MESKIAILLSVYNGEKYLAEQLDSLYKQQDVDICILVRDDGSSDSSLSILEKYKDLYGNMIIIKGENIGCSRSFYTLLQYAYENLKDYNFFSFCDQDDVWMENKLSTSIRYLSKTQKKYAFFHSAYYITDEELNIISKNRFVDNTLENNIISNFCLGCTQAFNRALLEKILLICKYQINNKINLIIHDALSSLTAFSLDADIYYSKEPTMYYRQHKHNVIGTSNNILINNYKRFERFIYKSPNIKSNKCKLMINAIGDNISPSEKNILNMCAYYNLKNNKKNLLLHKRMYSRGIVYSVGFIISVLMNKF